MDIDKRSVSVEQAHEYGWVHDMSVCTLCIAERNSAIKVLEAEGAFETLWKYYR